MITTRMIAAVLIALALQMTHAQSGITRTPVKLSAGEALYIPAGTIRSAKNAGTGNAAELATYIVEKGKPLLVTAE